MGYISASVEYPVGGRFIDILPVDRNAGYVVIELKMSRGYDRTVGQLLRYMAGSNSGSSVSLRRSSYPPFVGNLRTRPLPALVSAVLATRVASSS